MGPKLIYMELKLTYMGLNLTFMGLTGWPRPKFEISFLNNYVDFGVRIVKP